VKVHGTQHQETLNGLTAGPLTLTPLQSTLLYAHLKKTAMETWLAEHKTWTAQEAKAVLLEAARCGEGSLHNPFYRDKALKSEGILAALSDRVRGPGVPTGLNTDFSGLLCQTPREEWYYSILAAIFHLNRNGTTKAISIWEFRQSVLDRKCSFTTVS